MKRNATSFRLSRLRSGWSARALAGVLLCVLALRALVPTGFMLAPSTAEPGTLTLTICSSTSAYRVTVPDLAVAPDVASHQSNDRDQVPATLEQQMCGFVVASATDVPPNLDAYIPAYVALADVPAAPIRDLVATPTPVGPQLGSRAPPVTV